MSAVSPVESTGGGLHTQHPGGSGYGSGESVGTKSPLSMSLGFLKGLTQTKTTRDGQPSKRRGPKPDAKPALTRRQELNRQAQRTHRERKEIYIKALEEQVMQLKETFTGTVQEKNAVLNENRKLKDLLRMHGISYNSSDRSTSAGPPTTYTASSTDRSGSYGYNQSFSPPHSHTSGQLSPGTQDTMQAGSELLGGPQSLYPHHDSHQSSPQPPQQPQQPQQQAYDHDQLGVDFVLAQVPQASYARYLSPPTRAPPPSHHPLLEQPCMAHKQFMCVRSQTEVEPFPSGHALMASCPPLSHIRNHPEEPYPNKSLDIPNMDLINLLTLSQSLPLDGELTPVMALNMIRSHPRYGELNHKDWEALMGELKMKTRCYGFGAVLEEFELNDALSSVFAPKFDTFT